MDQGQVCGLKVSIVQESMAFDEENVYTWILQDLILLHRCRELERRRWSWRHATAAKQARFTIITNRVYVPRPDRNTTEWPPDVWANRGAQPASKAWLGTHSRRAHAHGPSNGNATAVPDDASLCKYSSEFIPLYYRNQNYLFLLIANFS